ncbi:MAG: PAS domain S-box protein, partial [Sedimentisphaerales bacterium]|nr:PAS domain S-box protein [Sedimentisphaerales bacterium]
MQNYNDKNTGKLQKKRKEKAKLETIQYQVSKDTKEEKSLHVEENIWEKIIHSVSDWIFLTDLDGRIIKTNEAGEKFTGFSCEEITGQLCCKLLHNSTKHVPDCPMQEMKRTGQKASSEILLPDGKWIQVTVDPVKNNDNKIESSIHIVRYITERKQTEEKLRSNEAQLSNAAKIAQIGYLEYDVADHLFIFNDQFYSIFRTTAEQVGGYTMTPERYAEMFIHPDDRLVVENEMKNIREISDTNFNRQLEHRILYADGGIGTISVRYFVIKNIQGRTLKIYGAIQDITERRQIKQELKKEQNLLRLLIDNIPDRIYIKDKEHRFILGNNAMIYYHGFQSEDEFIGKTDFDIYQEKYTKIFYSEEEDVIKNGKSIINERLSYKNKKGTEEWVLITKLPLRDMNGDIVGLVGITRDITEKKKTEYALRESEKKYRLLFESMMDGFALHEIVFDENNNPVDYLFIDINPAFEKLTGLKRDEIINKKASEVLPDIENDPGNWINKYVQVALTGQKCRFEEYSETLDRWYSVIAYCTNKNRFATIFEDITERKKAEDSLRKSEARYELAQRIGGIGTWEWNIETNEIYWSDEIESIFGFKEGQFDESLEAVKSRIHPEDY